VGFLDSAVLSTEQVMDSLGRAGIGADLVIIDGCGGLYDRNTSSGGVDSDADRIAMLSTPSILIVDFDDITASLAAVAQGFINFIDAPVIDGIIVNKIARHNAAKSSPGDMLSRCNRLFSELHLPRCLGCLPTYSCGASLPPRHVVQEANATALPFKLFTELENIVATNVNLDELLVIAQSAQPLAYHDISSRVSRGESRIAVASDNCFQVCYQDNLNLLRAHGAELLTFSPIADTALPHDIGGVYLPGGCLREYGETLERNETLLALLADFVKRGGALFSEGAGSAMLCRSFKPIGSDRAFRGAGVLPFDAVEASQHRNQATVTLLEHSVFGEFGQQVRGLMTGEWHVSDRNAGQGDDYVVIDTLRFEGGNGSVFHEGYSISTSSCSTFNFLHFGANPEFAGAFVEAVSDYQKVRSKP
jgi:cobyrinic acid a,c-diamide synthase